jgi:iron complex transport system substrate-binding protein
MIRLSNGAPCRILAAARAALAATLVHPAVCPHDRGGYSPGNRLSVELRGSMPLRPPAARFRQKRCGAALLLILLTAFFIGAGPARADDFMDAAGRHVVLPEPIRRVMAASPTAEVLVFVLAPDKLAGLSRPARRGGGAGRRVPVLSWRPGMGPASMAETARRLHPDVIVDAGSVTPERAAFADQVQQLTGIPYILIDDSFPRMATVLRGLGSLLDVGERARHLGRYTETAMNAMRGTLLIRPADNRPRVYYGRGADGLETALPGSPEGEALNEAGVINVAAPLGRGHLVAITPAQLLAWNPEIIIAERRSFYDALRRNRNWRGLAAVRNKRVYLAPSSPFGWIDDPAGVNRLIGLYWLSGLFYPDTTQEDLRAATCDFYDRFYGIKLTNGQIEAMLGPAGAPPADAPRGLGEPLLGLGSGPLSPLPGAMNTPTPPAASPPAAPTTPELPPTSGIPTSPGTPMTPNAPLTPNPATPNAPATPAAPSTAAVTCAVPGANSPLAMQSTTSSDALATGIVPGVAPPGRRGLSPGMGIPPREAPAR